MGQFSVAAVGHFYIAVNSYAVWRYFRFNPSHRDIEDLLAQRGIIVSYESIRLWCIIIAPADQGQGARDEMVDSVRMLRIITLCESGIS